MSALTDDLSQGGSLVPSEVWAAGEWVELKANPYRFSKDTARSPEIVAIRRACSAFVDAFEPALRRIAEGVMEIAGRFYEWWVDTFDVKRGEYLPAWRRSNPPIRAMDHRQISKMHHSAALDRRPMYRTFGGREGRRGQ